MSDNFVPPQRGRMEARMSTVPITTNTSSGVSHVGLVGDQPTFHIINNYGRIVELAGTWDDDFCTVAYVTGRALRVAGVGRDVRIDGWIIVEDITRDGITAHKHVGFGPRS